MNSLMFSRIWECCMCCLAYVMVGFSSQQMKAIDQKCGRVWDPTNPSCYTVFLQYLFKDLATAAFFSNPNAQQVNYTRIVQANRHNSVSNKLMENSFYLKLHKRHNYKYDKLKWTYVTVEYRQMNKLSLVTVCRNSWCILKCNMMAATFMGIKISLWCIKVYVISENV